MKEALFYKKQKNNSVSCCLCPHNCLIKTGQSGYCGVRENIRGQLYAMTNGLIAAAASDPVEKKPLYHFYPGETAFSLGGYGCNLKCRHCQNHEISQKRDEKSFSHLYQLTPEQIIDRALENKCRIIAWTYNEPTIWYEYILETSKLAAEKGLKTILITNGVINKTALEKLLPYIDAYRLDIKGFSDDFYKELTGFPYLQTVLTSGKTAFNMGCHVEIVTNIIPGLNNDKNQIKGISNWICEELDKSVPWHITAYFPANKMNLKAASIEILQQAALIGKSAGVEHIYLGNVYSAEEGKTVCANCGKTLIIRFGFSLKNNLTNRGKCPECHYRLKMYTDKNTESLVKR